VNDGERLEAHRWQCVSGEFYLRTSGHRCKEVAQDPVRRVQKREASETNRKGPKLKPRKSKFLILRYQEMEARFSEPTRREVSFPRRCVVP